MSRKLYTNKPRIYGTNTIPTTTTPILPPPHPKDTKSYNRYEAIQCKQCLLTLPNTDDYFYSSYIKTIKKFRTAPLCKTCTKASVTRYRKAAKQQQYDQLVALTPISPPTIPTNTKPLFSPASDFATKVFNQYIHSSPDIFQDPIASPIITHHSISSTTNLDKNYWPFIFHFAQVLQAPHRMRRNIAAYVFQLNLTTHTPAQLLAQIHQEFINTGAIKRATVDAPLSAIPLHIKNMLYEHFCMRGIPSFERHLTTNDLVQYISGSTTTNNPYSTTTPDNEHYMFYLDAFQKCMHQTKLQTLIRYKRCINCNRTLQTYHGSQSLHYNRLLFSHTAKNIKSRYNHQQTLPTFPAYFQKSKMSKSGWQQYCIVCRASSKFQHDNKRYHTSHLTTRAKLQLKVYNPLTLPFEIQYLMLPTYEQYEQDMVAIPAENITVRPYLAQSPHIYKNYAHRFTLYNNLVKKFNFQLLHEFYINNYQSNPADPSTRDKAAIYKFPPTPQALCKFHEINLPLQDPSQWTITQALSEADQEAITHIKQYTKPKKVKQKKPKPIPDPDANNDIDPLDKIPFDQFDPETYLLGPDTTPREPPA